MITISDGATCFDGPESVNIMVLATMVSGLRFEINCPGMRLTRGPTCYTLAKRRFGFRGCKAAVLAQLEQLYFESRLAHGPAVDERTAP